MRRDQVERLGGIEVDARCLPVIIITYHDDLAGKDFSAMTDRLVEAASTRRWLAMLNDTTPLTRVVGAADRKIISESIARSASVMDEKGISAVVIRNPIVRGAMTAAKWFAPSRFEERIFATPAAGAEWLLERLVTKSVDVSGIAAQLRVRLPV